MSEIRNELFNQLLRMYRMEAFGQLSEFLQGETAVMTALDDFREGVNPSVLSDMLHISRARIAQILTGLSRKLYVSMVTSKDDRRKTIVRLTTLGRANIRKKRAVVERYFDTLIEKLGDDKAASLSDMIGEIVNKMEETAI